jgi:hypothetical protein
MVCKCGTPLHQVRIDAGYKSCVNCSTEERWGVVNITYHKTGNTVEIVKDREVADRINAMAQRSGFGVMKGLTGSYAKAAKKNVGPMKVLPDKPINDRVLSRKSIPSEWEEVGKEVVEILEKHGAESAINHIHRAQETKRIYRNEVEKLIQIINHFNEKTT